MNAIQFHKRPSVKLRLLFSVMNMLSSEAYFPAYECVTGFIWRRTVKPEDRDQLAAFQKLEAINAELARHKRMAGIALLLVVLLNAVLLILLAVHLLGRD